MSFLGFLLKVKLRLLFFNEAIFYMFVIKGKSKYVFLRKKKKNANPTPLTKKSI